MRGSYFEALERLFGCVALQLGGELDKGDVVAIGHQAHLLESGELIEQHGEHHFVGLLRQIGEEKDLIWWLLCLCIRICIFCTALLLLLVPV